MTRPDSLDPFRYTVAPGEQVTFEITPVGTDRRGITASHGQEIPDANPSGTPTFKTVIEGQAGDDDFVMFEFGFLGGSTEDARFEIVLLGEQGERFDDIRPIRKDRNLRERVFTFRVAGVAA